MGYKTVTLNDIAEQLHLAQGTISKALRNDPAVKSSTRIKVKNLAQKLGYGIARPEISKPLQPTKSWVTIYDIARQLNLSASTVSRALNGNKRVKATTTQTILDVAISLGYTVNHQARELKCSKTVGDEVIEKPHITIYDIAKATGVSPSTVSKSFVENSGVSKETKIQVLQVASQMGFVPHEDARKLRTNKSYTIGLIVSKITGHEVQNVITGIEDTLRANGYSLLIINVLNNGLEKLDKKIPSICHYIDGLIIMPSLCTLNAGYLKQLAQLKHVVLLGSFAHELTVPKITIDQQQAAYDITKKLIRQGCRRILYADPALSEDDLSKRVEGYQKAHREANIPFINSMILNYDPIFFSSENFCNSVLSRLLPDGLILVDNVLNQHNLEGIKSTPLHSADRVAYAEFEIGSLRQATSNSAVKLCYDYFETGTLGTRLLLNALNANCHSHLKYIPHQILHSHENEACLIRSIV